MVNFLRLTEKRNQRNLDYDNLAILCYNSCIAGMELTGVLQRLS